jgi:hypothetical protein
MLDRSWSRNSIPLLLNLLLRVAVAGFFVHLSIQELVGIDHIPSTCGPPRLVECFE